MTVLQPLRRNESDPLHCEDLPTANLIRTSLWLLNQENWIERGAQSKGNAGTDSTSLSEAIEELGEVFKHITDKDQLQHEKNTINESETSETIPDDYPTAVIESIEKLRDAVVRAVGMAKPKSGKETYKTSEFIRKEKLGREFVQSYYMCFMKFPPLTIDGPVYNAFVVFLFAANLSDAGEWHCYKNAITNAKRRLKRKVAGSNEQT